MPFGVKEKILEISHNSELINLFAIEFFKESLGCIADILGGGDGPSDNKDVCAGFQRILYDVLADTACGCDEEFAARGLLDRRDVAPVVFVALGVDCTVHLDDTRDRTAFCKFCHEFCGFFNIEHVDDRVDAGLLRLDDEFFNG